MGRLHPPMAIRMRQLMVGLAALAIVASLCSAHEVSVGRRGGGRPSLRTLGTFVLTGNTAGNDEESESLDDVAELGETEDVVHSGFTALRTQTSKISKGVETTPKSDSFESALAKHMAKAVPGSNATVSRADSPSKHKGAVPNPKEGSKARAERKQGQWSNPTIKTMDLDELEKTKTISTSLFSRPAVARRGHMYCKEKWSVKVEGKDVHRCGLCTPGYFLVPDMVVGKMKQLGTCFEIESYMRWIRAKDAATAGKPLHSLCFKSFTNYGRARQPQRGVVKKYGKHNYATRVNLGFICVGAARIPQLGFNLYKKRAYVWQQVMGKATFVACHNTGFHTKKLECTKVTSSGPCQYARIYAAPANGTTTKGRFTKVKKKKLYLPISQASQHQYDARGALPVVRHGGNATAGEIGMADWEEKAKSLLNVLHKEASSGASPPEGLVYKSVKPSGSFRNGVKKCKRSQEKMWLAQF